ncbi:unnamed protein product [Cyprideis torosa]|uniref:Uncharacterized protein n=1 Tax=Cyprideis torosa TaxID=163714 RepID=A0A7R8ZUS4_9CRUS|nr:unnamed protein product [Cyprideis torosa]CAG0901373.1 unnamed protein product [Cyprideis torosa]
MGSKLDMAEPTDQTILKEVQPELKSEATCYKRRIEIYNFAYQSHHSTSNHCNVEGGESVVILDIEESRGNQIDQSTFPPELPITGNSGSDIVLEIEEGRSEGGRLFRLSGKRLRLTQPLDREDGDLSSLVFQLSCTVIST